MQNHVSHFYSGVCFRAMFTLVVQSVDFREQRWSGYFILTWSSVPVFCQLSFGSKRHTSQGFEVSCPCSEVDLNNIWFNAESTHFPWLSAIIILVIIIIIIILCRIWACMQVFDVITGLLCLHCVQWYWLITQIVHILWSPQEESKLSGHSEWTQSWPKRSVWYYSPIPPCFLVWWSQLQNRFGRWGKFKESVIFLLLVKKSVTSPPPKDYDVSLLVNS